jgi:hypothetical protein
MLPDPGFLSGNRLSMRERDELRALAEARRRTGLSRYRTATLVLVAAMAATALPALSPWVWPIVGGAGLLMTVLAVGIARQGLHGHAALCLLCAWAVLPGWVYAAPHALTAAAELASALAGHWRASLNPP